MKIKKIKNLSGMTLIEMMMSIVIFSIGIGGFTMLFQKTWQSNSYTLEMGQSSMAASQGVNKVVDYIRRARQGDDGSYPVQSVGDNDLVIFCDYDKDGTETERLHFYKNGNDILMGVTDPTATLPKTYPGLDEEIFTIVSNVVNDSSAPLFYYFNRDYPADTTNNPLVSPFLVSDIRLIKVYLEINIHPENAPDNMKIQSFAAMRNLSDYN